VDQGLVAAAFAVTLRSGRAAWNINPVTLEATSATRRAFVLAAMLLVGCIPLLALDGAGRLGTRGALTTLILLTGALLFADAGRRRATRTVRAKLKFPLRMLRPGAADLVIVSSAQLRRPNVAEAQRVAALGSPVLLLAITEDGHHVELNQN
jgi:hypothetical protein